jgi:hypothetical protein
MTEAGLAANAAGGKSAAISNKIEAAVIFRNMALLYQRPVILLAQLVENAALVMIDGMTFGEHRNSWLTISDMTKLARERGGQCLSDSYINSKTHLDWRCAGGHEWRSRPDNIKNGRWCPECSQKKPKTIDDMQRLAAKFGGVCISEKANGMHRPLRWRCHASHEFKMLPNNIREDHWCKACAIARRGAVKGDRRRQSVRSAALPPSSDRSAPDA